MTTLIDLYELYYLRKQILYGTCIPGTASDDATRSCPKGSGSIKVVGNSTVGFGQPTRGLEATESGVRLVYTSTEKPAHCLDVPTTTINFLCPQRGGVGNEALLYRPVMF